MLKERPATVRCRGEALIALPMNPNHVRSLLSLALFALLAVVGHAAELKKSTIRDQLEVARDNAYEAVMEMLAVVDREKNPTTAEAKRKLAEHEAELGARKAKLAVAETAFVAFEKGEAADATQPVDAAKSRSKAISAITAASVEAALDAKVKEELERTFLRKHGFAINLGYGYLSHLKAYTPDVQVRYNFLNQSQIDDVRRDRANGRKRTVAVKRDAPGFGGDLFTDFSGWIGYPLQKLENLERKVGTTTYAAGSEKEAPAVVGIGIGLGNGQEFSSAISVNAGVALFNNRAFKSRDLYLGVSVDAVLFKAIIKALADGTGK